ncbi:MAG TPA: CBS domain-containing protein [Tepidisphaeraceae bacterium]|jgi:CBS domain-containing protein|nr:CBS domain-containing protein [Tepidisphaeraceae bacterium]
MPQNSTLLLEKQLVSLAEGMTIELIMTARPHLVCVRDNQPVSAARQAMGRYYDQLPLVDAAGEVIGLVRRAALTTADDSAQVREYSVFSQGLTSVRSTDAIHDAITVLCSVDCALVFDPRTGRFCGLLHLSDLNKQAVRVYLYLWISALEMGLAEYLRHFHPRLKEWMDHVPSTNRASFLGDFILRKRQRIELSPVEGLYFSDMLVILRKLPLAPERLRIPKKDLESLAKPEPLNELRNMAMHPVRAIVHQMSDAVRVRDRLATIRKLIAATSAATAHQ